MENSSIRLLLSRIEHYPPSYTLKIHEAIDNRFILSPQKQTNFSCSTSLDMFERLLVIFVNILCTSPFAMFLYSRPPHIIPSLLSSLPILTHHRPTDCSAHGRWPRNRHDNQHHPLHCRRNPRPHSRLLYHLHVFPSQEQSPERSVSGWEKGWHL